VVTIRAHTQVDNQALALLFVEMQRHYRVFCPPVESIRNDLASLPAGTEILVAEETSIVGFAAFSAIYPGPGLKSGLFLKELFVSEKFRAAGIGRQLMRAVAQVAVDRGHGRVDWTADRKNGSLIAFYESLGAIKQEEKVFFRLTGDTLRRTAKGAVSGKDETSATGS
jgi:GNAT superfamily N-acetyltransferase